MAKTNTHSIDLGVYYRRIITALVGAVLMLKEDKEAVDNELLKSFNKVSPAIFPKHESHEFYLSKGREIAAKEIAEAMLLTFKARNRTKHLFRTEFADDELAAPDGSE